jgi:HSP20 family protein
MSSAEPFFPGSYVNEGWSLAETEGELAVDIFREGKTLIIRSPIAGVPLEKLDIAIDGDLLTIRGEREDLHDANEDDVFVHECYWGAFSRSIVLPVDVYGEQAEAAMKNGVLEIRIPIRNAEHRITIRTLEPQDESGSL